MTTAIFTENTTRPAASPIHVCERCHVPYDWRRSTSALRMTYCGILCEAGGLGFTIEGLLGTSQARPASARPGALAAR
jgi:hypothetical protein